jgi:hypothetical protein
MNLINDEIKLSRIKSKGGLGDGGRKPGSANKFTLAKLSDKVDTLANNLNAVSNNLDKLAKIVTSGFAEQAKFNKTIINRIDNLVKANNLKE